MGLFISRSHSLRTYTVAHKIIVIIIIIFSIFVIIIFNINNIIKRIGEKKDMEKTNDRK